jgi:hypothetical protein
MTSDPLGGVSVLPEIWSDLPAFRRLLAAFPDYGVNALLTEGDMSIENWRSTLAEVAGRKDLAGLAAFPGGSLVGNGRGQLLREVVG